MAQIVFAANDECQWIGCGYKDRMELEGHIVLPARNPHKLAELIKRRRPAGIVIFSSGPDKEGFLEAINDDKSIPILYLYYVKEPTQRPNLQALPVPETRNVLQKLAEFANSLE